MAACVKIVERKAQRNAIGRGKRRFGSPWLSLPLNIGPLSLKIVSMNVATKVNASCDEAGPGILLAQCCDLEVISIPGIRECDLIIVS